MVRCLKNGLGRRKASGGGDPRRPWAGCTPWRRSEANARRVGSAVGGLAVRMMGRFGSAVAPLAPRGSDRMAAELLARQDFHRLDVQRLAKLFAFSCRKLWISIPLRHTLKASNEAHSTNEKRHEQEHQPLRRRDPRDPAQVQRQQERCRAGQRS